MRNDAQHVYSIFNKRSAIFALLTECCGKMLYLFSSVQVNESTDIVYDKINRRLKHLTNLNTNSTKKESENMLVISIYTYICNNLLFYCLSMRAYI